MRQINQQGDGRLRLQVLAACRWYGNEFIRPDDFDSISSRGRPRRSRRRAGPGVNHGGSWPCVTGHWPGDVARVLRWMWRPGGRRPTTNEGSTNWTNEEDPSVHHRRQLTARTDGFLTNVTVTAGAFCDNIWKSRLLTESGYAQFS